MIVRSFRLSLWSQRVLCAIVLLIVPTMVALNLIGKARIGWGGQLTGVVVEKPLNWTWASFGDGTLQKAISDRVTAAIPLRNQLVRLNNQIRFSAFGATSAQDMFIGDNGQLIAAYYIGEYCQRTDDKAARLADSLAPVLLDIQSYYRARGSAFVYLITPSKMAHQPQYFETRFPCPSTVSARTRFVPEFVDRVRSKGIAVVDAATLVHDLKTKLGMELFPPGGLHWNYLGAAHGTLSLIDEINRQRPDRPLPRPSLSYEMTDKIPNADRDLAELLNVLVPPVSYRVPKVHLDTGPPCPPELTSLNAAIVGTSFSHYPAELLIQSACLSDLKLYFYLRLILFGGNPYGPLRDAATEEDLARLRTADIVILEDNEAFIGSSSPINGLRKLLSH